MYIPVCQIESLSYGQSNFRRQFRRYEHEALVFLQNCAVMAVHSIVDSAATFRDEREVLLRALIVRAVGYPVEWELVHYVVRPWFLETKKYIY